MIAHRYHCVFRSLSHFGEIVSEFLYEVGLNYALVTVHFFLLVPCQAWIKSVAQIGKKLDGLCADAHNFIRNCMAHHSHASYKGLPLVKYVLVKDFVFNLINTFLTKSPSTGKYHSDDGLAKDFNEGRSSSTFITGDRFTILRFFFVELFSRSVLRRLVGPRICLESRKHLVINV